MKWKRGCSMFYSTEFPVVACFSFDLNENKFRNEGLRNRLKKWDLRLQILALNIQTSKQGD